MNLSRILILFFGIIISIIIIFFIFLYFRRIIKDIEYKKFLNFIKDKNNKIGFKLIKNNYKRIGSIAAQNNKYSDIFLDISNKYDYLDNAISNLYDGNNGIRSFLANFKTNSRKYNKNYINRYAIKIDEIIDKSEEFKNEMNKIIYQDDELQNEMSIFRIKFKKWHSIYIKKKIILKEVSQPIENLIGEIIEYHKEFNENFFEGNYKKINNILDKYKVNVIKFIETINYLPALLTYLNKKINKDFKFLLTFYESKQGHFDNNFLDIKEIAQNIKLIRNKIGIHIYNLDIKNSEFEINNVYKIINLTLKKINIELHAKQFFIKNFEKIINEIEKTINKYIEFIKKANSRNVAKSILNFDEMKNLILNLEDEKLKLEDEYSKSNINYSTKVLKLNNLIDLNNKFVNKLNLNFKNFINNDNKIFNLRNKAEYLTNFILEIKSYAYKRKIKLDENWENIYRECLNKLNEIKRELVIENASKFEEYLNEIKNKTKLLYEYVSIENEYIEIINNLFSYFNSQRSSDPKLDFEINQVENKFISQNYSEALKIFIEAIGG